MVFAAVYAYGITPYIKAKADGAFSLSGIKTHRFGKNTNKILTNEVLFICLSMKKDYFIL